MFSIRANLVIGSLVLFSACDVSESETGKLAESVTGGDASDASDASIDAGAFCGDAVIQSDEECDPGDEEHEVVSDGSRGLPQGTRYDAWNCNPRTCKRRYIYTPCEGVGWEVESCPGGFCDGTVCQPLAVDECKEWGIENPVVSCTFEGDARGLCGYDRCFPLCETEVDCPQNSECKTLYPNDRDKVCQARH